MYLKITKNYRYHDFLKQKYLMGEIPNDFNFPVQPISEIYLFSDIRKSISCDQKYFDGWKYFLISEIKVFFISIFLVWLVSFPSYIVKNHLQVPGFLCKQLGSFL